MSGASEDLGGVGGTAGLYDEDTDEGTGHVVGSEVRSKVRLRDNTLLRLILRDNALLRLIFNSFVCRTNVTLLMNMFSWFLTIQNITRIYLCN